MGASGKTPNVILNVLGNGTSIDTSGAFTGTTPRAPLKFSADVTGVYLLTLNVDPNGVNWFDRAEYGLVARDTEIGDCALTLAYRSRDVAGNTSAPVTPLVIDAVTTPGPTPSNDTSSTATAAASELSHTDAGAAPLLIVRMGVLLLGTVLTLARRRAQHG